MMELQAAAEGAEQFLIHAGVWKTWDKSDQIQPYKLFPTSKPAVPLMIRWWLDHQKTAFPKSRDVMCTLTMLGCHAWDAIFHEGRQQVMISDKSEKAEANVDDIWRSYLRLPGEWQERLPAEMKRGNSGLARLIRFLPRPGLWPGAPDYGGSEIMAIGRGAEQFQSLHPSCVMLDQVETTPNVEETYNAIAPIIKPQLRKGISVKMTIVGTPCPGWWYRLVFDLLEAW